MGELLTRRSDEFDRSSDDDEPRDVLRPRVSPEPRKKSLSEPFRRNELPPPRIGTPFCAIAVESDEEDERGEPIGEPDAGLYDDDDDDAPIGEPLAVVGLLPETLIAPAKRGSFRIDAAPVPPLPELDSRERGLRMPRFGWSRDVGGLYGPRPPGEADTGDELDSLDWLGELSVDDDCDDEVVEPAAWSCGEEGVGDVSPEYEFVYDADVCEGAP